MKQQKDQENPAIDEFIDDVIAVCRKHGLSIEPDEFPRSLFISNWNEETCKWLREAADAT